MSFASSLFDNIKGLPAVSGIVGITGGVVGMASPALAGNGQGQVPTGLVPPWLEPFMPMIILAITGTGSALLGWLLKTVFGMGTAAAVVMLRTGRLAIERNAKKTPDTFDDTWAAIVGAGMGAMADKLEAAEKTLPVKKDGVE